MKHILYVSYRKVVTFGNERLSRESIKTIVGGLKLLLLFYVIVLLAPKTALANTPKDHQIFISSAREFKLGQGPPRGAFEHSRNYYASYSKRIKDDVLFNDFYLFSEFALNKHNNYIFNEKSETREFQKYDVRSTGIYSGLSIKQYSKRLQLSFGALLGAVHLKTLEVTNGVNLREDKSVKAVFLVNFGMQYTLVTSKGVDYQLGISWRGHIPIANRNSIVEGPNQAFGNIGFSLGVGW